LPRITWKSSAVAEAEELETSAVDLEKGGEDEEEKEKRKKEEKEGRERRKRKTEGEVEA